MAHTVSIHISSLTGKYVSLQNFFFLHFFFIYNTDNISAVIVRGISELCVPIFPPLLTSFFFFFTIRLEGVSMATRERLGDGVGVLKQLSLEIGQFSPSLSLSGPAKTGPRNVQKGLSVFN